MPLPKYKKQFWAVVSIGIFIILCAGGGLSFYLIRYSATSDRVCFECHPELVDLWKNSNGHPADSTSCHECHSPGRKLLPSDWQIGKHVRNQIAPSEYSADDSLTSQRCQDCHADVLTLGYKVKKKVIKFTHRFHIEEGLECVDCHRTAGHAYMEGSSNRPGIEECRACHIKEFFGPPKSQKCLSCHDVILTPGRTLQ